MTDYYVDTINGSSGNNGLTPETAFKSIADILGALPEGDHTIYCTGGADPVPGTLGDEVSISAIGAANSATIVGNWSGFDINEDCYYITRSTLTTAWYGIIGGPGAGKKITFDRIKVMSDPASYATSEYSVISGAGGGFIEFNNSCAVLSMSATCPNPHVVYLNAQTGLSAVNSIFAFGDVPLDITPDARAVRNTGSTYPMIIANSILSPGVNTNITSIARGSASSLTQFTNCVMLGAVTRATAKNCLTTGATDGGALDGGSTATLANIKGMYVDAEGGNFTPVSLTTGPTALVDEGIDYSDNVSSLDINGNDRFDPAAGAEWDIGPYEWGFAAEPAVPPTITTTTLNAMTVGAAFSQTLAATGDIPITFATQAGAIPAGLSLASSGAITGTPTTEGAYSWTVRATNVAGFDDQLYTGTVVAEPTTETGTNVIGGPFRTQAGAAGDGPANLEAFLTSEGWYVIRNGENFTIVSTTRVDDTPCYWRFTWAEAQAGVYESILPAPLRNDIDDGMGR